MALVLSSARPGAALTPFAFFAALGRQVKIVRRARANREALRYLAQLDDSRLDDLGISRADISDAINGGPTLARRRAENARMALAR